MMKDAQNKDSDDSFGSDHSGDGSPKRSYAETKEERRDRERMEAQALLLK